MTRKGEEICHLLMFSPVVLLFGNSNHVIFSTLSICRQREQIVGWCDSIDMFGRSSCHSRISVAAMEVQRKIERLDHILVLVLSWFGEL